MTWRPRSFSTLDERERAAYADGDTATADLLTLAQEGGAETRSDLDDANTSISSLHAELDDAQEAARIAGAELEALQRGIEDIDEEMLLPIHNFVKSYFEDDRVTDQLLELIKSTQDNLYARLQALLK